MGLNSLMSAIKTFLQGINDGGSPTPKYYLDHVWLGRPNKLPMGNVSVSFFEIDRQPDFYYTLCDTIMEEDVDVLITVMCKGSVEQAHINLYTIIDAIKTAWKSNRKFSGACIGSTIEDIEYGDVAESVVDPKILATAARIRIRCRL